MEAEQKEELTLTFMFPLVDLVQIIFKKKMSSSDNVFPDVIDESTPTVCSSSVCPVSDFKDSMMFPLAPPSGQAVHVYHDQC